MPLDLDPELLGEKRQVTVILRLVLDARGNLVHGEVVDARGNACARFQNWRSVSRTVRGCLNAFQQGAAARVHRKRHISLNPTP